MHGQPRARWVVTTGGVDQQHIRANGQRVDGRRERQSFAEREPSALVGGTDDARHRHTRDRLQAGALDDDDAGPSVVTGAARALLPVREHEEAPADEQPLRGGLPRRRRDRGQPQLLGIERGGVFRPLPSWRVTHTPMVPVPRPDQRRRCALRTIVRLRREPKVCSG